MTRETNIATAPQTIADLLSASRTQTGHSLTELCEQGPVLLVFLRHAGCTFCRETLSDIAEARADLERDGTRIVVVHLGDADALSRLLAKHGLEHLDRIFDPEQRLYDAFGLKRGTFGELFGWKVFTRAIFEGALFRHGIGSVSGDPTQLPGAFLIREGKIERRFRHRTAADRADFVKMCTPAR